MSILVPLDINGIAVKRSSLDPNPFHTASVVWGGVQRRDGESAGGGGVIRAEGGAAQRCLAVPAHPSAREAAGSCNANLKPRLTVGSSFGDFVARDQR